MDNKTEYFTLKEDGVIGWIPIMPQEPAPHYAAENASKHYQEALQSAISNAIEVSNQEEVKVHIFRTNPGLQYILENTPYPLQCHVEKEQHIRLKGIESEWKKIIKPEHYQPGEAWETKTVALVTFPSSAEVEETQEELEDRVQIKLSMNLGTFERVIKALKTDPEIWEEVKEELTRLLKEFETP